MIKAFCIKLSPKNMKDSEPLYKVAGKGDSWSNYIDIRVPGFSGSVVIGLEAVWREAINEMKPYLKREVSGRETIVKFGQTQQLIEEYLVEMWIEYD